MLFLALASKRYMYATKNEALSELSIVEEAARRVLAGLPAYVRD